jgi:uncharacterized protein YjdB
MQFLATGVLSDGTNINLTSPVTWVSSDPGVAIIDFSGQATAFGVGSTTITARSGNITGSTTLTVTSF